MSEHYVEMVHTFVLVNVPAFISTIWTIAKPLLPERTKNKVKILGGNWKQEILEFADSEVLPVFWNGPGESVSLRRGFNINTLFRHSKRQF
jgi:hypothetical protein